MNLWKGLYTPEMKLDFQGQVFISFLASGLISFKRQRFWGPKKLKFTQVLMSYRRTGDTPCYISEEEGCRTERLGLVMGVGKRQGNFTYLQFWQGLTGIVSSIMSYKISIKEKDKFKLQNDQIIRVICCGAKQKVLKL